MNQLRPSPHSVEQTCLDLRIAQDTVASDSRDYRTPEISDYYEMRPASAYRTLTTGCTLSGEQFQQFGQALYDVIRVVCEVGPPSIAND